MPNWVHTTMTVTGHKRLLDKFQEKAAKPYTSTHLGTYTDGKYDADAINTVVNESEISFWNFIAPTDLVAYVAEEKKPDNYETMSNDERMVEAMQFRGDNWYNWNVRNWGTKWDASDVTLDEPTYHLTTGGVDGELVYHFSTAWSPADGAFRAMAEQHPNLEFEFVNVEEQGWGVVFEGKNGELNEVRSWDIPSSHQEWEDSGSECSRCSWHDETEWYEDCPKQSAPTDPEFVVSE